MITYLGLTIVTILISYCQCFAEYEMFEGFDVTKSFHHTDIGELSSTPSQDKIGNNYEAIKNRVAPLHTKTDTLTKSIDTQFRTKVIRMTPKMKTISGTTAKLLKPIIAQKFHCPKDEKPINIGAYEVPTERDLVLLIRKILIRSFNSYQKKALHFLKDIQQATKATSAMAKTCHTVSKDHEGYRKCVKRVSIQCQSITKTLIASLENQRQNVSAFIEGTICNVTEAQADPIQLIKTLAVNEASLEFALPGFLRMLNACSVYCEKHPRNKEQKRPTRVRHLTDQELVVKHFLTKKSYLDLLKGSK